MRGKVKIASHVFLPLTFIGFFLTAKLSERLAAGWLTGASVFFYGWWNPIYVPLLLASVLFNYAAPRMLVRSRPPLTRWLLRGAIMRPSFTEFEPDGRETEIVFERRVRSWGGVRGAFRRSERAQYVDPILSSASGQHPVFRFCRRITEHR